MNLIIPYFFDIIKINWRVLRVFMLMIFGGGGGKELFELTLISNIKEMIIKTHEEFTALEYLGLIIKF